MGFFTRFTNPIWNEVKQLPQQSQVFAVALIISYGYLREMVKEKLVNVFILNSILPNEERLVKEDNLDFAMNNLEFLIDEAVVGILCCCEHPTEDLSGKLSNHFVSILPELLGPIALADANKRLNRTYPTLLEQTNYSCKSSLTCNQVLSAWQGILRINNLIFLENARKAGFSDAWTSLKNSVFYAFLIGLNNSGNDLVFESAKIISFKTPNHLRSYYIHLIQRIGEYCHNNKMKKKDGAELVEGKNNVSEIRSPIKVLIVDDNEGNRGNYMDFLQDASDIQVVGEAVNGKEAISLFENLRPDVLLMDIDMPVQDGFSATREICNRYPSATVIICSIKGNHVTMRQAVLAGAKNYLKFPILDSELLNTIRCAMKYETASDTIGDKITEIEENLKLIGGFVIAKMNKDNFTINQIPENSCQKRFSVSGNCLTFDILQKWNPVGGSIDPIYQIPEIAFNTGFMMSKIRNVDFSKTWLAIRIQDEGHQNDWGKWNNWLVSCKANDLINSISAKESDGEFEVFSNIMSIMYFWEK